MSTNLLPASLAASFLSWAPVLSQGELALKATQTTEGFTILTLWANRGGGKTTCLNWLQGELAGRESVAVAGLWDIVPDRLDEIIEQINAQVVAAAAGKVKVVLIDNVDRLLTEDAGLFFHFEKAVVLPLVMRSDCVVVTTSRSVLRQWQEYEVRDRHANFPIPWLGTDDLARLASYWGAQADRLSAATLGYPQVISWLHARPTLTDDDLAERIIAHFFEDLSKPTVELARAVCLLPMFNVAMLRQILTGENATPDGLYADLLDRLREMMGMGLIFWDSPPGLYRFSSGVVRRLLARSRWQQRDAELRRVHAIAANYFQLEARRLAYLPYSFIGVLYHLSWVDRIDDLSPTGEAGLRWIDENFSHWTGADWPRVRDVWQSGASDSNLVVELQALLGQDAYDQISRRLEQAAQPAEVHP